MEGEIKLGTLVVNCLFYPASEHLSHLVLPGPRDAAVGVDRDINILVAAFFYVFADRQRPGQYPVCLLPVPGY